MSGTNARWSGGVGKFPIPGIAIKYAGIACIDRGEKEIEVAVVVVISQGRAGIGFLPVQVCSVAFIFKGKFTSWTAITKKLGPILIGRWMAEVTNEEIKVSIIIEITPS